MMKNLPIRARLTWFYSGLLFLALMVFATSAISMLRERLTTRLEASLDKRAKGLEDFLRRETTPEKASHIPEEAVEYAFTQPEGHLMEVVDGSGRTVLQSDKVTPPGLVRQRTFELYGQTYRVRAAGSLDSVEETTRELRLLLLWSAPLLLSLLAGAGYWISGRALTPVDQMTRAAKSISVHNLEKRLDVPPGRDELSRLADAWNEMLSRLEESINRMRRFTGDAAHELRTPLTALRTTAELALRRPRSTTEYREALQQVVRISEGMTVLADDLLTLARGDEPAPLPSIGVTDLRDVIHRVVGEVQPMLKEKGQRIEVNVPEVPALITGDARGLARLTAALLDNAVKYTPVGGSIRLQLRQCVAEYELEVLDSGEGIPDEEIPYIFNRFYRVDQSRDRQTGGHGLGLAIAQQIVDAHHGSIEAITAPGGGACFRVRLARDPDAQAGQ